MFKKILIANRGEIACRIARTCHRLGIDVAGVHSRADADALHVKTIGESIEIGDAPAAESYLRIDSIVAAAKAVGAQAIHPGFGFLAENPAFARAVEEAGLVFIGPTPETIERLGDKAQAKREAEAAGVPTVPGSSAATEDAERLAASAREIGLPVMLKAAGGGGGRGMRVVADPAQLDAEINSAMREAKSSFGNAALIVEKLVEGGRHIEVQIAGDGEGNVIHLFERECSLQRRHQKLIEEAPAANLSASLREKMLGDAVRLGRRLNYRGVGTVEFILSDDAYYFLEVNPRLQVEHPVTEMITGLDIVEAMLRIANAEGLPIRQDDVVCRGHAVEARICAEDAADNFLPSTGTLSLVRFPNDSVRVETGVESGSEVTPYYDSMIAKLIAHDQTREAALDRLNAALGETAIFGVITNVAFLRKLVALPETRAATFHTRLIDERLGLLVERASVPPMHALAVAACHWMVSQRTATDDLWRCREMTGWHMGSGGDALSPVPLLHIEVNGTSAEVRFAPLEADGTMLIGIDDRKMAVKLEPVDPHKYLVACDGRQEAVTVFRDDETIYVHDHEGTHALRVIPYLRHISTRAESSGELRAPMMGIITKVNVAVGEPIKAGDVAAVMESMKMELRIASKIDGVVAAVGCAVGDMVERNAIVAVVEPAQ